MLKRNEEGEIEFSDARWHPTGTITCMVTDVNDGEVVPFSADPEDPEEVGRELFSMLSFKYADQVAPCTDEEKFNWYARIVRMERDDLLINTDWTQLPDVPESTKEKWGAYRQALRDISKQAGFPHEVTWPVSPVQFPG